MNPKLKKNLHHLGALIGFLLVVALFGGAW